MFKIFKPKFSKPNLLFENCILNEQNGWSGKIDVDNKLTLYYQITDGIYYHAEVSSEPKFKSGFYYGCDNLAETLDEAKKHILDFVEMVKEIRMICNE